MMTIEQLLDKEFERIQNTTYFDLKISYKENILKNEWNTLKNEFNKSNSSKIINEFHPSRYFANKRNSLSPFEGWEEIKSDKEKFKKLLLNRIKYKFNSEIPEEIPLYTYSQGMNVLRWHSEVSYFKPSLAKYLINKYLSEYNIIYDPFSGYSGRMLGTLACGKEYSGQDINDITIEESIELYNWLKSIDETTPEAYLEQGDSLITNTRMPCLFTCPPYKDIEEWEGTDLEIKSCDDWIDIILEKNKCEKYLFVVDNKIEKYKSYVVEELSNNSHFSKNVEFVVLI